MAWREPERNTISLSKCEIGREIVGSFTGVKKVQANNKEQNIYQFTDEEDKPFGIWGCAQMDFQMDGVKVGMHCKVTYLGKAEKKNNFGNYSTLCKVEIWDKEEGE